MSTQALSPSDSIVVAQNFLATEAVDLMQTMLGFCKRKMDSLAQNPEKFEALSIRDLRSLAKMLHDVLKDLSYYAFPESQSKPNRKSESKTAPHTSAYQAATSAKAYLTAPAGKSAAASAKHDLKETAESLRALLADVTSQQHATVSPQEHTNALSTNSTSSNPLAAKSPPSFQDHFRLGKRKKK